jgi:K+-sensing histidine kinase KdpD
VYDRSHRYDHESIVMSELKAGPVGVPVRQWHRPTRLTRYGAAVALVLAALALRWAIFGHLDNRLPFSFFLVAVMVAAWYGGLGPGMLAAAGGLLLGDYFFLPQHGAYAALNPAARTAITVYAINATLIVVLMENLHARIRKLESVAQDQRAEDRPESK